MLTLLYILWKQTDRQTEQESPFQTSRWTENITFYILAAVQGPFYLFRTVKICKLNPQGLFSGALAIQPMITLLYYFYYIIFLSIQTRLCLKHFGPGMYKLFSFVLMLGITIADLFGMACQSSVESFSFRIVHIKRVFLHASFREGREISITWFLYSLFATQNNCLGYLNRYKAFIQYHH